MTIVTRELLRAFEDSKTGNIQNLKHLVANGLPIDSTLPFTRILDVSVLNANLLQVACAYGRINTVNYLLINKIDVNYREGNGHYALHFAALGRHNQIIEMLIKRKADPQCRNFQGFTPLHFGCKLGGTESISFLVNKGADVNAKTYINELTPLHVACENQQLMSVRILIECGADIDSKTSECWTPMHYAANQGNLNIVKELIQAGAIVNCYTITKDSPLHFAAKAGSGAKSGSSALVKLLISNGAIVNCKNSSGETPLMLAASKGHVMSVNYLLEAKANINDINDKKISFFYFFYQTALHLAVQYGFKDVVELLIKSGANADTQDIYLNTPLSKAQIKGNEAIIQLLTVHKSKSRSKSLMPPNFSRSKSNEFSSEKPVINQTFVISNSLENIQEEVALSNNESESAQSD